MAVTDWGDADREWLREMAKEEVSLRRWIHGRRLPLLGAGVGSVVFAAGRDYAIRVTTPRSECKRMEEIQKSYRGAVIGWPRIYDLYGVPETMQEDGWDRKCVAIVERVRVDDDIPDRMWEDFSNALSLVDWAHGLKDLPAYCSLSSHGIEMSPRSYEWATQLYQGLVVAGVWRRSYGLDASYQNAGLTRDGDAVWVDFGI